MESSPFDEQIFSDFAGPLSPLGAKQIPQSGHSIHVMLGMNSGASSDMCNQRLPEVQSLLPGSPKLNNYKSLDYNKMDYNGKMTPYSSTPPPPPPKYDYLNGKMDQYSPNHLTKIDYGKPIDYNSNAKMDYGGNANKLEYDPHMQMYQQPSQQVQPQPPPHSSQPTQSMESPSSMADKKKSDDSHALGSTTPTTTSDATSTSKKNDKKKGDINGVKKKKTR